ncbi:hypothetical protein ACFLTX_01100 [Chloroflexota bacterium]
MQSMAIQLTAIASRLAGIKANIPNTRYSRTEAQLRGSVSWSKPEIIINEINIIENPIIKGRLVSLTNHAGEIARKDASDENSRENLIGMIIDQKDKAIEVNIVLPTAINQKNRNCGRIFFTVIIANADNSDIKNGRNIIIMGDFTNKQVIFINSK